MSATKWLLFLGLALLLVGVGGAGWVANHFWGPYAHTPSGSETSLADDAEEGVVCTGYVDLEHGVRSLAPIRPGRVAEILAKETQHVEPGMPLLRLEDVDAKFQVDEAESALAAAEVQLAQSSELAERQRARRAQQQAAIEAAGFRLNAAHELLRRKEEKFKDNLIAASEVRAMRDEVKALEAVQRAEREKLAELKAVDPELAVRKAKAEVKLMQTRRDHARHQLDECTLKAPATGTIHRISVGAGDLVTGNPSQPVVRFCPDETPLIRAEVNQEFADRVKVGQTALIRDDARAGANWRGKVRRVADWYERRRPDTEDPSAYTDVRTVECLISIDPGQPPLRIGQRMRVMIGLVPSTAGP
ncbi:MAG TPA: HlyD family efflux transporter periplasmic adaptor subunit [Gemmataceae bacterium]